jgi:CSLREA domain-containing protein
VLASHQPRRRALLAAALPLALSLLLAAPVAADTFRPTRFDDPPPDACKPANCSLREAILAANDNLGRDTVALRAGTYEMEIPPAPANLITGDFNAFGEITIRGQGPKETRIEGNSLDTVMTIAGADAKLKSVKVKGGFADALGTSGGGLLLSGHVTLTNVVVKGNEASFSGGGIWSDAASLTIKKSTITRNDASEGAGIDLRPGFSETPVTQIRSSTISLNHANAKAAGVLADGVGNGSATWVPLVTLENSTVARNTAVDPVGDGGTRAGGGIMADNGATVALDNSTVTHNQAGELAENGVGGGIYQHSNAGFALGDSVIAQNSVGLNGMLGTILSGAQCAGLFQGSGGVVVELQNGTACVISGDIREPDNAEVDELANNGGPTRTVAIAPPSVAIGYAVSCPARDQRGVPRPATGCDSGAFEHAGP